MVDYSFDALQQARDMTPPDKRTERTMAWLQVFADKFQYDHYILFQEYVLGSGVLLWNPLTTYNKGDRIRDYDRGVYESIVDGNIGIQPTQALNASDFWLKITNDYRGARERLNYNSRVLVLEYILNKFFGSVFRQPDDVAFPALSDIKIRNNPLNNNMFVVYDDPVQASKVFAQDIYVQQYILDDYSFANNAFTILVPETGASPNPGFYTSLQPNADAKIRSVADRYVIAGILYNIETY